jgi:hypothetical protein
MTQSPNTPPEDAKNASSPDAESDVHAIVSSQPVKSPRRNALPFSRWWPLMFGALCGLVLRFVFLGKPGGAYAPMGTAFVLLVPLAVGAITVYVAEREAPRNFGYYVAAGFWANVFFVLGSLLVLIEGLICAILIVPMFAVYGMFGAIIMGIICKATKWPRHAAYSFFALPIVFGAIPSTALEETSIRTVHHEIVVNAPTGKLWAQLMSLEKIEPSEMRHGWMYRIGVPLPESATVRNENESLVRTLRMGKGIRFEQVSNEWRANEYVRWRYRFAPDSFPKGALDDHVTIGGRYFDVIDTTYRLERLSDTQTKLIGTMSFRVTTEFNWYANHIGDALVGNFTEVALELYKRRAEAGGGRS